MLHGVGDLTSTSNLPRFDYHYVFQYIQFSERERGGRETERDSEREREREREADSESEMQRERDTQTERQKEINVILPHGTDCSTVLGIQLPHLTLQDLIISMFSIFPMFRERERERDTDRETERDKCNPPRWHRLHHSVEN